MLTLCLASSNKDVALAAAGATLKGGERRTDSSSVDYDTKSGMGSI